MRLVGGQRLFTITGLSIWNSRHVCSKMKTYYVHFTLFVHSGHFYSTSLSMLLLRSAPDTARILCWSFTPKRHRQMVGCLVSKCNHGCPQVFVQREQNILGESKI